jgi:hypothetical protein
MDTGMEVLPDVDILSHRSLAHVNHDHAGYATPLLQPSFTDVIHHDHNYATTHEHVIDTLKRKLQDAEERVAYFKTEARLAKIREKRAKMKNEALLAELQEAKRVNVEMKDLLNTYQSRLISIGNTLIKIKHSFFPLLDIPVEIFERPAQAYSEEQRQFAATLHFYSPRAYLYLRQKMPLPHPSSLRR